MYAAELKSVSFAYFKNRPVLKEVSLYVEQGETIVFAGLSGCGKTTLCHIICGFIPNAVKGGLKGEVFINGESISKKSIAQISGSVAMVFQKADEQTVCTTVEDELAFGLENRCVPPQEIRARVDEAAARFGLERYMLRSPSSLSGGERKLLTIASVLITEPQIIILDEPMSHLDTEGRALVRAAIDSLRAEKRTLIIVEHDLSLVDYADRWIILKDGCVAVEGAPTGLLADKQSLRALEMYYD